MKLATLATGEDYGNCLDAVAAYLSTDKLNINEKKILVDFLQTEFRTVHPDEILEAVKGAISGRIQCPNDITRIRKLSAGWFGSVLQGYKAKRSLQRARPEPITPENITNRLSQFGGVEGKDQEYYDLLRKWYFEHGQLPPYGWAYLQARRYAKTLDDFGVTEKDTTLIRERAKADKMNRPKMLGVPTKEQNKVEQQDLDKQVMRLHFERLTQTR